MTPSTNPPTKSPDRPTARSSMFWRLWWRAISVKRSQAALAIGSLCVGAAISSMLLNLYGGVRRDMTEEFRAYGANVVVAPASGGPAGYADNANVLEQAALSPLAQFARRTPGTYFAPILYGVVQVSPDPADPRLPELTNAVAAGADFGTLRRLNPGWREAGQASSADLSSSECAVGSSLAARLHLRPGASIQIHRVPEAKGTNAGMVQIFHVAAVLTTGASEDDQLFVALAALQTFLNMPGKVTLVEMSIPGDTKQVVAAVQQLAGLMRGLEVRPIRQIVYSEGKVLGTIRWLLLSLTVLILVIIALCVTATMTAMVLERRKDIAVMKALGAADGLLSRLFMMEGASLGLVAGAAGFGLGAWLARALSIRLFGVALSVNAWTLPVVCGLAVALAVIAAQAPVRILRAIQPTIVLKGE